jgi:hypothetical protein
MTSAEPATPATGALVPNAVMRARRWRRLAAGAVIAGVLIGGALLTPGDSSEPVERDVFTIADKQIPLPRGDWRIVASAQREVRAPNLGAYGTIHNVLLAHFDGDRVEALVEINANAIAVTSGWGTTRQCSRRDIHAASHLYVSDRDGLCYHVNHVVTEADNSSPIWRQLVERAADKGWRLPQAWLVAGLRASNRYDLVDVRYYFNPEIAGFAPARGPWASNDWSPERVAQQGLRASFVRTLVAWTRQLAPVVERGLQGRLDPERSLAMPWSPLTPISAPAGEAPDKGEEAPSLWSNALYRTITYRIVSSTTTFLTALPFFYPDLYTTLVYTAAQGVTHGLLFYANEVGWAHYLQGLLPGSPRVIDIPPIGSDA